ncbi:MAG TPA: hypothetical protein VNL15_04025, partial [Dehalococcoidia bacterium]|nr:hypothetical protein [Dehalococcoidia bacterium]
MRTWSRTLHLPDLSLGRSSIVLALLAVGLASEALYLASVVDPWWFWDHFPPGSQRSPLTTANSLAGFAISMVDLFALYALAAYLLRRASLVEGPVAAAILFGFPCLFGASLLL